MAQKPNTTYGITRIVGYGEDRLRRDRTYGLHVNAVLVQMPGYADEEPFVEMIPGFGTTMKQARSEASVYAARAGYTVLS